jgi:hypothetical protein
MTSAVTREEASKSRWLTRSVLGIGLASLCSDVGHEMATTAMPVLLASLGATSAILGLIEGLADGLSSLPNCFPEFTATGFAIGSHWQ